MLGGNANADTSDCNTGNSKRLITLGGSNVAFMIFSLLETILKFEKVDKCIGAITFKLNVKSVVSFLDPNIQTSRTFAKINVLKAIVTMLFIFSYHIETRRNRNSH